MPNNLGKPVYIFQDVDGVWNSKRSLLAYGTFLAEGLDPVAIRLVDTLFAKLREAGTDPRLVISSTWRIAHPELIWWKKLLADYPNIYVEGLNPVTPDSSTERGAECLAYLKSVGQTGALWIAFDDGVLGKKGADHLVQTSPLIGLDMPDIDNAFYLLTGQTLVPGGFAFSGKWAAMRQWHRQKYRPVD